MGGLGGWRLSAGDGGPWGLDPEEGRLGNAPRRGRLLAAGNTVLRAPRRRCPCLPPTPPLALPRQPPPQQPSVRQGTSTAGAHLQPRPACRVHHVVQRLEPLLAVLAGGQLEGGGGGLGVGPGAQGGHARGGRPLQDLVHDLLAGLVSCRGGARGLGWGRVKGWGEGEGAEARGACVGCEGSGAPPPCPAWGDRPPCPDRRWAGQGSEAGGWGWWAGICGRAL
jgi:hypothetical protein